MIANMTAFLSFYAAAIRLRNEADANAFLAQWEGAFQDEAWWVRAGAPGVRVSLMLQAIMPLYLRARAEASAGKASSGKGKREGTGRRSKRPILATVGEEESRFHRYNDAEEWCMRRLLEAGEYVSGVITDEREPEGSRLRSTTIERSRAVRKLWGRREGTMATRSIGGSVSGPWMKASQTRSSFSRG